MARITGITYETTAEAATATACLLKFGTATLDVLVTNWLANHAEEFKREDVELLLTHAKTDSTIQTALTSLIAQAKVIETTKVATPVTFIVDPKVV